MTSAKYSVFYSWQTDNSIFDDDIMMALKQLKDENIIDFTRYLTEDKSGSPDIVDVIKNKINNCDIFIADMTTITNIEKKDGEIKYFQNPNVSFELGYATNILPVECILIITDNINGLPFDIRQQRISTFKPNDKRNVKKIKLYVNEAIKTSTKNKKINNIYRKFNCRCCVCFEKYSLNDLKNVPVGNDYLLLCDSCYTKEHYINNYNISFLDMYKLLNNENINYNESNIIDNIEILKKHINEKDPKKLRLYNKYIYANAQPKYGYLFLQYLINYIELMDSNKNFTNDFCSILYCLHLCYNVHNQEIQEILQLLSRHIIILIRDKKYMDTIGKNPCLLKCLTSIGIYMCGDNFIEYKKNIIGYTKKYDKINSDLYDIFKYTLKLMIYYKKNQDPYAIEQENSNNKYYFAIGMMEKPFRYVGKKTNNENEMIALGSEILKNMGTKILDV